MNKVKAVCIGLGMTGSQCASMMINRGVEIVGAVDANPAVVGMDIGERIGVGRLGISVESDLDALLQRTKPDIAVMATLSMLKDIGEQVKICLRNKVNVITTSERAFFWKYEEERELGEEIDRLAKENGVTVFASGVQDSNWSVMPLAMSASCHAVKSITGTCVALVDEFGPAVMEEIGIGTPEAEFSGMASSAEAPAPDAFTISVYALAEKLGLTPIKRSVSFKGLVSEKPVFCQALNKEISPGELIGTNTITVIETEEGVPLTCQFISKLTEEGDSAYNKWEIEGEPNLSIFMEDMHGEVTTTGGIINRIADVINARPGFLTVNDMPVPYFHFAPMGEYTK